MHIDNLKTAESRQLIDLFKNQKFDSAIDYLFTIKDQLPESSFYYNLGILYTHQDNYPAGKLNLYKSKMKGFNATDVKQKITDLNSAMGLEKEYMTLKDQSIFYLNKISASDYLLGGSCFFSLCLIFILKKKLYRFSLILAALLISSIPYVGYQTYLKDIDYAVILTKANLRSGPSKIFEPESELKAGTRIAIQRRFKDWLYIIAPEKFEGWIKQDKIGFY